MIKKYLKSDNICIYLFERLKEGLKTLGVLNAIEEHSTVMEELFCGGPPPLSAASLLDLFKVQYSLKGSNRRALEEVAVGHWRDWIIEVDGESMSFYF